MSAGAFERMGVCGRAPAVVESGIVDRLARSCPEPLQRTPAPQRHLILAVFAMLAALLLAVPADAAGPRLKLRRARGSTADAPLVALYVLSSAPLGAYTLQLSFDPSVLELRSVGGGSAEFGATPFNDPSEFSTGVVRFSAFQVMGMNGPKGRCHVATFAFRPRVNKGRTRVTVEAITFADTKGNTYQPPKYVKNVVFRTH